MRSCSSVVATLLLLSCSRNRPQRPPGGPPALEGGAVARAQEASHLEEHRCSGLCVVVFFILRLNFQASSQLLPVFLPAGEGPSSCRSSDRRHVCRARRGGAPSSSQSPQGMRVNWMWLMQEEL